MDKKQNYCMELNAFFILCIARRKKFNIKFRLHLTPEKYPITTGLNLILPKAANILMPNSSQQIRRQKLV